MTALALRPDIPDLLGTSPADLIDQVAEQPVAAAADARDRADRIRADLVSYTRMRQDIADAYACRDWLALGYGGWFEYVDAEFGTELRKLARDRDERREVVRDLRTQGMSDRAIGAALGVDHKTVAADLRAGGENSPPRAEPKPEAPAAPAKVMGKDGKSYPASKPAAKPERPCGAKKPHPAHEGDYRCPGVADAPEAAPADPYAHWRDDERDLLAQLQAGQTVVVSMRIHTNLITWAENTGLYERIDRRTPWGNPFETPADGDRDTVIANYAEHYLPYKPSLLDRIESLAGKALGCWCAPENCHGDVLKEATEQ